MTYQVKVGICDIDSYDMIFYSNYLKYNERAARHFLGDNSCQLVHVKIIKYLKSVQWESDAHIETHVLSANGANVDLLHIWMLNGKPVNQSVMEYQISTPVPREKMGEIPRLSKFLFHEWRKNASFTPISVRKMETPFYSDMAGFGGRMAKGTCLDLMERQRTDMIGGQPVLRKLKLEDNTLIVVVNIYDLVFGDTILDVGDTITCESGGEIAPDQKSFIVRQIIRRGDDIVCNGLVKLCFIRDGKTVPYEKQIKNDCIH